MYSSSLVDGGMLVLTSVLIDYCCNNTCCNTLGIVAVLVDVHGCCVLLLLTGSVGSCNSSSGSIISMYSTVCIPICRLYTW